MNHHIFVFYYLAMAFLVGLCAIGRRPGFLATFLLSILVTPFLALLLLYLKQVLFPGRRRDADWRT